MNSAVTLIRSAALSDAAEYAYAATVPAGTRLIFPAGGSFEETDGTTAVLREASRWGSRSAQEGRHRRC